MFCLSYDLFMLPMEAFDLPLSGALDALGLLTLIYWTIDIPATFVTGYYVGQGAHVEKRLTHIARHYLKTWFAPDVSIVLVDWVVLDAAYTNFVRLGKAVRFVRLARTLRLLRGFKAMNRMGFITGQFSEGWVVMGRIGYYILLVAAVNHFIACGWWAIGIAGDEQARWVQEVLDLEDRGRDIGYQYLTSLHWSLTQFTPASMEVHPHSFHERLFTVAVLFMGLLVFSSFVSSITAATTYLRHVTTERVKREREIRRFLKDHSVSLELCSRIGIFLKQRRNRAKQALHEHEVMELKDLPTAMHLKLHWEMYYRIVSSHPYFFNLCDFDRTAMEEVCHLAMTEQRAIASQELFHYGMKASKMLFTVYRELHYFFVNSDDPMCTEESRVSVHTNQWITEMALWMNWVHRGRLVSCTETVELVELDAAKFQSIIQHWDMAFDCCHAYARRYVERICQRPSELLTDLSENADDLQQLAHEAVDEVAELHHPQEDLPTEEQLIRTTSALSKSSINKFADAMRSVTGLFRQTSPTGQQS